VKSSSYNLTGAAILAGDDLSLIKRGYVSVADGVITAVGEGHPANGAKSIDLAGRLLVPGFINGHTHLGDSICKERGYGLPSGTNLLWAPCGLRFKWMAEHTREARIAAMRRAIEGMIATGTVAFADFRENGVGGVTELREACAGSPITGLIYARFGGEPAQTAEELAGNTARLSADRLRELDECLAVADGFSPVWANELTDPALAQVTARVRASGKRLATHAIETPLYRELSVKRTGRGDVERILDIVQPDFLVHMTNATPHELELVGRAGIPLVLCPRGQAALANGFPPLKGARDAGIKLALGSDNAMLNTADALKEMDFMARTTPAVTGDSGAVQAIELLRAATIGGARTLGLSDRLGSIAAGKSASLIVFDTTTPNFANSADLAASVVLSAAQVDIEAVLINGVPAYGSLKTA
jgi:cytosine/adenosine deaminase-related metal-dependent hydrolase